MRISKKIVPGKRLRNGGAVVLKRLGSVPYAGNTYGVWRLRCDCGATYVQNTHKILVKTGHGGKHGCPKCVEARRLKKITKLAKQNRLLTTAQAKEVLKRYPAESIRALAKAYRVGRSTIHRIVTGERYKDLPGSRLELGYEYGPIRKVLNEQKENAE